MACATIHLVIAKKDVDFKTSELEIYYKMISKR